MLFCSEVAGLIPIMGVYNLLEPLRVCVIGQVSAVKSSIINTLTKKISAEVSALPSISWMMVCQCQLEGIDMLHLIDLPGLDGNEATKHYLLEQAIRANIILWVLKANQPGRAQDPIERDKALQALDAIQSDSGVVIPGNVVIELIEAARSAPPIMMRFVSVWTRPSAK